MNTQPWVYVLQHIAIETPGTIEVALRLHGISTRVISSFAGEPVPADMHGAAGLVVMGGPMGVYEQSQYQFLQAELRLIEQALAEHKPVLGVCLGSQLLATVLGASVVKGRQKELGWHLVTLTQQARSDALWQAVPTSFMGYHWHGDIFEVPASAVCLATTDLTPCQAFQYEQRAYGLLCHLEVTPSIIKDMVKTFQQEQQEAGVDGEMILKQAHQFLPSLQVIGSSVFLAWAARLSSSSS
ncbi:type 1 glutamine amidotransferase [Ktedonosporobacter rubrisoli]|uniref:Type 1 glutamine amidotransferase n=1 Tax=Ktedonosporobacter rubrisoli TaxID=2509675 RepID=A0A4P6K0R6_KTERU|nr:type 1 glutamine amidotransferase [Ktedonosporobacter rubrisoli]QBD81006.1 type 1 glutamine amidotransferase [Ktedonosporobacter rubrisoli]